MDKCYRIKFLYRKEHLAPALDIKDEYYTDTIDNINEIILKHAKETGKKYSAMLAAAFLDYIDENGYIVPQSSYVIHNLNGEATLSKYEILNSPDFRIKK